MGKSSKIKRITPSILLAAACLFSANGRSQGGEFPREEWPREHGSRARALYELLEPFLFAPGGDEKAPVSNGALVIYKGTIFYESYRGDQGFSPTTRHPWWSATKSLLHGLTGVAVEQKLLSLADPVSKWIPELAAADVTVENLLHMASCLRWSEKYTAGQLVNSSVVAMLYGHGLGDMAKFVWDRPLACQPGNHFRYSSGDTVLLSAVLGRVFSQQKKDTFHWSELFGPIGAGGIVIERDGAGSLVGSSFGHGTLRDMARFGYLYLKQGRWRDQQLLPSGWFEHALRSSSAFGKAQQETDGRGWNYGAHWWSNGAAGDLPSGILSLPEDILLSWGHWGQFMAVIPSKDLVVLRVGTDRNGGRFPIATLLRKVVAWVDGRKDDVSDVSDAARKDHSSVALDERNAVGETSWFDVPAISSAFVAKTMCSCFFVANLPEELCRAYAGQSPALARGWIDHEKSTVRAAFRFFSWNGSGAYERQARWISDQEGCRSEVAH